jgi:hypothetical protein
MDNQPVVEYDIMEVMEMLKNKVKIKDRRHYLNVYRNCFLGHEACDVLEKEFDLSTEEALELGQLLHEEGYFHHVIDVEKPFLNGNYFYRFHHVLTDQEIVDYVDDNWIREMKILIDIDQKNSKWEKIKSTNSEINLYKRGNDTPIDSMKIFMTLTSTVDDMVELLHTQFLQRYLEWNDYFEEGNIVREVSNDINIHHLRFRASSDLVAQREYLVARRVVTYDDGAIGIFEKSVEDGRVPQHKTLVRAEIIYNVRYFRPLTGRKGCQYFQISLSDLKGWIPPFIANQTWKDLIQSEAQQIHIYSTNNTTVDEE